jgi:hypothetical protein
LRTRLLLAFVEEPTAKNKLLLGEVLSVGLMKDSK